MGGKYFYTALDSDNRMQDQIGLQATDSDQNTAMHFGVKIAKVRQIEAFTILPV